MERGAALVVEGLAEGAGGSDAGRERRPQILEVRVAGAHHERAEAHVAQSRVAPQLGQLALGAPAHDGALVDGRGALGIDLAGGVPERAQERHLARVVPDAGGDDAARAGHARHLAHARLGVAP